MNKIHKIIVGSTLSMIMAVSSITGVSAATSYGYNTEIKVNGEPANITINQVSANYKWGLNYMPSKSGGTITSQYYAAYSSGSFTLSGSAINISGSNSQIASAIWRPTGITTYPVFFGDAGTYQSNTCTGSKVSSSFCAKSGNRYRLVISNESSQKITIGGQFTLTN